MTSAVPFLWPPGTRAVTQHDVPLVLWALKLDGPIRESNATRTLLNRIERRGESLERIGSSLSPLLDELASDRFGRPLIWREMRPPSKRTYGLGLMDDVTEADLPPNPFKVEQVVPPEPEPEPEPELREAEPPSDPVVVAPPDPVLTDENSMSLFDKLEVITRFTFEVMGALPALMSSSDASDRDQAERLAAALEDVERWRRRAREAEETASAHRFALEAEQRKNRRLEANNAALLRAERPADDSGFRALRNVMQEKPRMKEVG